MKNPKASQNTSSQDPPPKVAYEEAFNLAFDLTRLKAYHRSEHSFYNLLSKIVSIGSVVLGASAFAAVLADYKFISALLTAILTVLKCFDIYIDFKERSRFHAAQRIHYETLANELQKHRADYKWVRQNRAKVEKEWSEKSPYTIRWAVDAWAYNEAVWELFPDGAVKPKDLFEIWLWEHAVAHFWSFSRNWFRRRYDWSLAQPAKVQITFGVLLIAIPLCAIGLVAGVQPDFLGFAPRLFWIALAGTAFLISLDGGYHKIERAIRELMQRQ